ncbi:Methyltransferase type 11 [Patulibacter medicamentivorans]|uniref:Methyltransferase type 11 n=1 Tax=Patulibacter medicamentivorans TaxID=1097667 RepID=H0E1S5_9ACTN|nr:methyltransferase domain-containing protein [Patulibacter medicamentivorans]EHN12376.1 Methyltransferase type 11 [Patulibacter medicamentivorans]
MSSMDWSAQGGSGPAVYEDFLVPGMFTPFGQRLVADAGIGPGDRVLDIACGTGAVSRAAAAAAGPDGQVTGVDLGAPMVAVARAQTAPDGAAPIDYRVGPADALPVADGAFDVATCHHGLQFFPDRAAALRELRRALAPGGRVAIACWGPIDGNAGFDALAEALGRHVGGEAGEMMRSPFVLDRVALEALLRDAGFAQVSSDEVTMTARFSSRSAFGSRTVSAGPIAPLFAAAPDAARAAVDADVAAALEPFAVDGGVAFPVTSHVAFAVAPAG